MFLAGMYVLLCYLLGSLNSAMVVTRLWTGRDIRQFGDGNAGATNVFQNVSRLLNVLVFVLDFAKGVVVVVVGRGYFGSDLLTALGGGFLILGHDFPLFFGLKGGTGIACMFGQLSAIDLWLALGTGAGYLLTFLLTRRLGIRMFGFSPHEEGEIAGYLIVLVATLFSRSVLLKLWFGVALAVVLVKHRKKVLSLFGLGESHHG